MRINRWWALGVTLVLSLGGSRCWPGPDVGPIGDPQEPGPESFECPKTWEWDGLTILDPRDQGTLSGPDTIQNIPEFHDCQRFLVDRGFTEGVFSIFAILSTRTSNPNIYGGAAQAGLGLPAAQIFASEAYGPLSLERGLNCLYLFREQDGWGAAIRSDGSVEVACNEPVPISTLTSGPDYTRLRAWPDVPAGSVAMTDEYPVAARWIWDPEARGGEYYIGVWCDGSWCGVASTGHTVVSAFERLSQNQQNDLSREWKSVMQVKGRYDEQILSWLDPSGTLVASGLLGVVYPEPNLGRYVGQDFAGQWQPTARVELRRDARFGGGNPGAELKYRKALNLEPVDAPMQDFSQVYLCQGDWTNDCWEQGAPNLAPCDGQLWWGKVINPAGDAIYRCVRQCPYNIQIPGTVRWRWSEHDEGIWMRCVNGCCELGVN